MHLCAGVAADRDFIYPISLNTCFFFKRSIWLFEVKLYLPLAWVQRHPPVQVTVIEEEKDDIAETGKKHPTASCSIACLTIKHPEKNDRKCWHKIAV